MTSYSAMAAQGREESAAKTTGRRKRLAERIEWAEPVTHPSGYVTREARLVGECGHTLRWLAAATGTPDNPPHYLASKLGRRMTCEHDDCRIPAKGETTR